jgi:hypothetical protein
MRHLRICAALATLLLYRADRVLAEDYWTATYQDFDVTTADTGGGHRAQNLARNLARFDKALAHILSLRQRHVPTHIYELPRKEEKDLLGEVGVASYRFDGYEFTVVTDSGSDPGNRYWGALFGYAGSLLINGRTARYPYWFQVGAPQLFAQAEFDPDHVKTGAMSAGFAHVLMTTKLIPMRVFLGIQPGDPQLRSAPTYLTLFEAESWFLAREVLIEGKLRQEFGHYLDLVQDGKSETDAFRASFKLSYEDLDSLLNKALREPTHLFSVPVPREPADNAQPRRLSGAQVKAQLAELSLQWQHRDNALRLATEALKQDAGNELALRVQAVAHVQEGDFEAALAAADQLTALRAPSAVALTGSGNVLAQLSRAVFEKKASIGVDAASLGHRATEAYERAINLDSEYLPAWAGLANLYSKPDATPAAQALVPRAQPVMERHSDNAALARALATMCAQTDQTAPAFLFGELWRNDATSARDRDQAVAFIARMQTH